MKNSIKIIILSVAVSGVGRADLLEVRDRMEINWSTMSMRFVGIAKFTDDKGAWKDTEIEARNEGLKYIFKAVSELRKAKYGLVGQDHDPLAEQASMDVATSSYSKNTTYVADGSVEVTMENRLAKALRPPVTDLKPLAGRSTHTGILIHISEMRSEPTPIYRLVNEDGVVLFNYRSVNGDALKKRLMGRWFRAKQQGWQRYVGENPARIEASYVSPGTFRVASEAFAKLLDEDSGLLGDAKIAISIDQSTLAARP